MTLLEAVLFYLNRQEHPVPRAQGVHYYPDKNADEIHSVIDDYITSDISFLKAYLEALEQAKEKGLFPQEDWVERLKKHLK